MQRQRVTQLTSDHRRIFGDGRILRLHLEGGGRE
jgi:hypothetical protein